MKKKNELNFDLKQIRSYLEILNKNSFTRASRKLKIGQATISHQIQSLEEMLGVQLIKRTSKEFSVTHEGRIFETFCQKLFSDIEQLKVDFDKGLFGGYVKITSSTIPSTYILPKIISKIKKIKPDFFYKVNISDSREAIEIVKEGNADIGIVGKKIKNSSLEYKKCYNDEIVLIGSENEPDKIDVKDLIEIPFVTRESGSGTKNAYEIVLKQYNIVPSDLNIVFECSTSEAIKESIASGIGVSFISKLAIEKELKLKKIKIITINDFIISRDFFAVYMKNKHLSPAAQKLLEMLI